MGKRWRTPGFLKLLKDRPFIYFLSLLAYHQNNWPPIATYVTKKPFCVFYHYSIKKVKTYTISSFIARSQNHETSYFNQLDICQNPEIVIRPGYYCSGCYS